MSKMEDAVPVETLRELFEYDSARGVLVWKRDAGRHGQIKKGSPAGSLNGQGYRYIHIRKGVLLRAARVVWAVVNGEWPAEEVIHRDRNLSNDSIGNLVLKSQAPKAEFGYQSVVQNSELTAETLRNVLDYDPLTGVFTWRAKVGRQTSLGSVAGSNGNHGHWAISLGGRDYLAGRLAWLYAYGTWPARLAYRNGDKHDLRLANLAEQRALPKRFDHDTPEGKAAYAKAYRGQFPDHVKDRELRNSFGIRIADYQAMHAAQGGVCAICRKPETATRGGKVKALAVDHDHRTGALRGLLCAHCNTAIGKFGDDPSILRSAIRYLETHAALSDAA